MKDNFLSYCYQPPTVAVWFYDESWSCYKVGSERREKFVFPVPEKWGRGFCFLYLPFSSQIQPDLSSKLGYERGKNKNKTENSPPLHCIFDSLIQYACCCLLFRALKKLLFVLCPEFLVVVSRRERLAVVLHVEWDWKSYCNP